MKATESTVPLPQSIGYSDARQLARHSDVRVRQSLAEHRATPREVLYYLAEDASAEVRRAVANNEQTPRHADLLLADDPETAVRGDLAAKIARLVPGLPEDVHDRLYKLTADVLMRLARDQVVRVREILSDALREVANAPPEVIAILARDPVASVAVPVLAHSPVLTDEDLLEIIASEPIHEALAAVAGRQALASTVVDAVVAVGDVAATTRLLVNPSAQIREETLDKLIAAAPGVSPWHAPLARRPRLSASAARRIAGFVASALLDELRQRTDLDPAALEAVSEVVAERLGDTGARPPVDPDWARNAATKAEPDDGDPDWAREQEEEDREDPAARAQRLHEAGQLKEEIVADAIVAGDRAFALAAIALLSELPEAMVSKTLALRNAKGIAAVVWRAGFSARLAVRVQMQLAGIAPNKTLRATYDGAFPLSDQELQWQLDFIAGMTRG